MRSTAEREGKRQRRSSTNQIFAESPEAVLAKGLRQSFGHLRKYEIVSPDVETIQANYFGSSISIMEVLSKPKIPES